MQLNCPQTKFYPQNYKNMHNNGQSPIYKRTNGLKIHSIQAEQNKSNITNASYVSNTRTDKSKEQRPGSMSRGIKVLSRNSSFQKKSSNSNQRHSGQNKQSIGSILNCYNNQTVEIHQFKSMQTLKSQIHTYNQLFSDRQKHQRHTFQLKNNGSSRTKLQDNLSYLRKDMQTQVINIKTIYQHKYKSALDQLNAFYSEEIDKVARLNEQNEQKLQKQAVLIQKLQHKLLKEQKRQKKYNQRFQSLYGYIQQSSSYTIERISEMDSKLNVIVKQFGSLEGQKDQIQNKIQYLFEVFSSVLKRLVLKGKSVQSDMKRDIKGILQKYQQFEERIYQMDLNKNLGKENQIQNIRINEKINELKQFVSLITKKSNFNFAIQDNTTIIKSCPDKQNQQVLMISSNIKGYKLTHFYIQQLLQNLQKKIKGYEQQNKEISRSQSKKQEQTKKYIKQLQNRSLLKQEQVKCLSQERTRKQIALKQYARVNQIMRSKSQQYASYITQLQEKLIATKTTLQDTQNNLRQSRKRIQQHFTQTQLQVVQRQVVQNLKSEYQSILKNYQINIQIQEQQQQRLKQEQNQVLSENQQLQNALDYSEKMFDGQIAKFKHQIQDLMAQNEKLKSNFSQLQNSKLSEKNDSMLRPTVKLCKSPKKQNSNSKNTNWKDAILMAQQHTKHKQQKNQDCGIQYKKNIRQVLQQSPSNGSQQSNQLDQQLYSFSKIAKTQSAQSYYPPPNGSQKSIYESQTSIMKSHSNIMKSEKGMINLAQNNICSLSQKGQKNKRMNKRSMKVQKLKKIVQFYSNRLPIRCEIDYTGYLKYYESGKYVMNQNEQLFELTEQEVRLAIQMNLILL